MPKLRRAGGKPETSCPSTSTLPPPGSSVSKPAINRSAVVLPLPLGPSSATTSPRSTARVSPSSTRRTDQQGVSRLATGGAATAARAARSSPKVLARRSSSRKGGIRVAGSARRRPGRRCGPAAAHGAIPDDHPFLQVAVDQPLVHRGGDQRAQPLLRPSRQPFGPQVGARPPPVPLSARQPLALGPAVGLHQLRG